MLVDDWGARICLRVKESRIWQLIYKSQPRQTSFKRIMLDDLGLLKSLW